MRRILASLGLVLLLGVELHAHAPSMERVTLEGGGRDVPCPVCAQMGGLQTPDLELGGIALPEGRRFVLLPRNPDLPTPLVSRTLPARGPPAAPP